MVKILLKHTRQIDQYIRKKLLEGLSISVPEDRDKIIVSFLETHKTDNADGMTPEVVAFFLQSLNTHGLYEQLDNKKFSIVFPTYIPFEVEEVAASHGYPDIYRTIEKNLFARAASGNVTVPQDKAASLDKESFDVFEKVADDNTREVKKNYRDKYEITRAAKLAEARINAADLYWKTSNMDEFVDAGVSDPRYLKAIDGVKTSSIRGMKDKQASVQDFKNFLSYISDIVKYSK
ncbi:MAG: hypothetical protein WC279_13075 [Sulfurimonas sp.]